VPAALTNAIAKADVAELETDAGVCRDDRECDPAGHERDEAPADRGR